MAKSGIKKDFPVGIIAPSSKVPPLEFALGLDRLREADFEPIVHPQCAEGHLFFAGTDESRAQAVYDFALDSRFRVLWCARGGYGAMRLLPLLERMTAARGIPRRKKLMVGFSDSTALLEFVRNRWGWATLHGPMPGLRKFCALPEAEWTSLSRLIRGEPVRSPFGNALLEFIGAPPKSSIEGPVVGGNLSVWTSLVGTPYAGVARGKIVFFEDVDENLYRVDRMVQQLLAADALKGARAVVLGNFLGCRDQVPSMLKALKKMPSGARERERMIRTPRPDELEPLRESMAPDEALASIFSEISRKYCIPVAFGLPVGHGPEKSPLPLGARYSLSPRGELKLLRWSWK